MLHNREYPSPGSIIKKSAVLRRENISKKNGEMSCNFGEIIQKLYFLVWWKARQRATHTPPPTSLRAVTAHFTHGVRQVRTASARFTCENHSREGGEGGVICETVPFNNGSSD